MKKSLSVLLSLALVLSVFTFAPMTARAAVNVDYIDANGNLMQTAPGVNVTELISSADISNLPTSDTLNSGWYLVSGTFTHTGTITVSGDVHLILGDTYTLTVTGAVNNAGINVSTGNSLTIYAQSATGTMGSLNATGGSCGAGIGGSGVAGSENGGTITINGGTVTANGGYLGAGIGGGYDNSGAVGGASGNITINGGTVTATGGNSGSYGGAGIGGGGTGVRCGRYDCQYHGGRNALRAVAGRCLRQPRNRRV